MEFHPLSVPERMANLFPRGLQCSDLKLIRPSVGPAMTIGPAMTVL